MGVILSVLGVILLVLVAVVLIRTLSVKPDSAAKAQVPQSDPKRAMAYGEKLGEMIRCETISERNQADRSKFYAYHEVLEKLFPHVFATCEKHVFDDSDGCIVCGG